VAICFVGTFSYWYGIPVLQQAIAELADSGQTGNLRFILVGDGPLNHDMRQALKKYVTEGIVIFTGAMPHDSVIAHLDASDILVSPHLPMPDGRPFFGSPTKLFEYMAMGKAIVASNLDQLALVLRHNHSAWLVTPGNASELAAGIALLSNDPRLRERLGANAQAAAVAEHTWQHNAARVLKRLGRKGVLEVHQAAG
jgi:glycosyltransferase involved in cell wall biosynthesis